MVLNAINDQYCGFLETQIAQKEQMQIKCNSVYEFRVLQCFDSNYQDEIRAMLSHIKNNKICQTNDNHRFRQSDSIIVQKLDQMAILQSSAIMVDSKYIAQIKHFCSSAGMSYLVWDTRLINTYKQGSRQELISRLNSVDLVIMDGKESSRITTFLSNTTQLIPLDDELLALRKLLRLVGDQAYLEENINDQLTEVRNSLQYLIERNKDPFLYTQSVDRHFYVCPQGFKVSGLSFQRFVLVSGAKPPSKPIFSKCSWIIHALKDGQQYNNLSTAPFLKKLEQLGLQYNSTLITIQAYKFLFDQVCDKSEIKVEFREYQQKSSLLSLKYKTRTALSHYLESRTFQSLPFDILYAKDKQTNTPQEQTINGGISEPEEQVQNPFVGAEMSLSNSVKKINQLCVNYSRHVNIHLESIIRKNIEDACSVCYSNAHLNKFVFGCCGCSISTNCLLILIKNWGIIKCPSCRYEMNDDNADMGFFISLETQTQEAVIYYKDFNSCFRANRDINLDSFVYGAGLRTEPGQFVPSNNGTRTNMCQLFICIDQVCPDISHLIIEHQSTQDYIWYHIQRIIHQQIAKSGYKKTQVIVYSANPNIYQFNQIMTRSDKQLN